MVVSQIGCVYVCTAALSLGRFSILQFELPFHAYNVRLSVENLEAIDAKTNLALVTFKNMCSVNLTVGSPSMQGTFGRYLGGGCNWKVFYISA